MNIKAALAATSLALVVTPLAVLADATYVYDNAHLFSQAAIDRVNAKVGDFQQQSGKQVVVVTVPSLGGKTAQHVAEDAFAQHQINGVEIFVSKAEKQIGVVPDRAAARFFPAGTTSSIRTAIRASFNSGDFDGGLNNGVDLVLGQYRGHLGALNSNRVAHPVGAGAGSTQRQDSGGFSMGWIWWILVLAVIFFVVRGIFRAMAGPRMMGGPGMGGPGYGPGYGPGMGGPGYGYGGGGGGGGFWSGLLGGLGGAFIGNELFGNRGGFGGGSENVSGVGGDAYQQQDASGFQSDAGQADMSNSSFGGYGDSGGGWGGGGDSGGGGGWGGGDSGGGGGDSGGGW